MKQGVKILIGVAATIVTGIIGYFVYIRFIRKVPGTNYTFHDLKKKIVNIKEGDLDKEISNFGVIKTPADLKAQPEWFSGWVDDEYSKAFATNSRVWKDANRKTHPIPTTNNSELPTNNQAALDFAKKFIFPYMVDYQKKHLNWNMIVMESNKEPEFITTELIEMGVEDPVTAAEWLKSHM